MAKSKLIEANQKIAKGVTEGFQKIEDAVVGGYKKIEQGVVDGYTKIEDKFVAVSDPRRRNRRRSQSPAEEHAGGIKNCTPPLGCNFY